MSGIGLKIPEIRRMRTRTRLLKATTISGICDRIPDIWHTFSLGTTRPSRIRPRKKEKQRIEKCLRLCGGITRTYRRRMAGVKIVDGEIAGGEDVIPATDLGDENAAVFVGNLIVVRTRHCFSRKPHHCPNSTLVLAIRLNMYQQRVFLAR